VKKGQTVFVQVKVLASFLPNFALRAKAGRKEASVAGMAGVVQ
jgi:hypothetical protein